jgi:hypothetical protein
MCSILNNSNNDDDYDDDDDDNNNNNNNDFADSSKTLQIVIPRVVVCSVLLILVGIWVVYARAHPNTASGLCLIEVRFIHLLFI